MLKLAVFNLMKYSFNKKAWVSNMTMQRSSPQETNLKGLAKANERPKSFTFFLDVFRNSFQQEGKSWWDILS